MTESNSPYDGLQLRRLVAELCNGDIAPERHRELDELLATSDEARREYWELMGIHSGLHWALADKDSIDAEFNSLLVDSATEIFPSSDVATGRWSAKWKPVAWAVAACLLLGMTVLALRSDFLNGRDRIADQRAKVEAPVALGFLKSLRPDTNWSLGKPGLDDSKQIFPGDTVWLDRGAAELHLSNQIVAKLEAPLILQAVSLERVRMLQGRITVDVAKGAEGFTVETNSAEVIDLGTTFSVEVADSNTDVVVFQGAVDLRVAEPIDGGAGDIAGPTKRLHAGEAVRVSGDRTLSRIVNVTQTNFSQLNNSEDSPYRGVISHVTDNINRDDLWSFYEIVPGGMGEDVRAFVDRRHEWNGVDIAGLPDYLVGGDYVKTFNDDKATIDLRVDVMLERPATMYILLDTRVEPPKWLTDAFENTGDVVGVDEAWHDPNNFKPGLEDFAEQGAGKSIEEKHSVWKRVVAAGDVVTLGHNGQLPDKTKWRGTRAGANMYGIVAVPLDK